ncbi:hypothetical protein GGS21DRAFT_532087 [Xylaria nigripes]|nr:hypothetical protein GGS21DRAFT_532087 [Xylaria nigripes]
MYSIRYCAPTLVISLSLSLSQDYASDAGQIDTQSRGIATEDANAMIGNGNRQLEINQDCGAICQRKNWERCSQSQETREHMDRVNSV